MPRRPQLPEECANCNRLSEHLIRGRCGTCYSYWLKHDHQERPIHLWSRTAGAVVWLEAGEPFCDCGGAAVAWLSVPINGESRAVLPLCGECAELERALSVGSSWSAD